MNIFRFLPLLKVPSFILKFKSSLFEWIIGRGWEILQPFMHKDILWHRWALVLQNVCNNSLLSRPRNAGTCRSTRLWAPEGASITSEIKLSPAVRRLSLFWMPTCARLFLSQRCSASRRNTENQTVSSSSGQQWVFHSGTVALRNVGRLVFLCLLLVATVMNIYIFRLVAINNITARWSCVHIFFIPDKSQVDTTLCFSFFFLPFFVT